MTAVAMRMVFPNDALVADIEAHAKRHGLVVVTDGHELRYIQRGTPLPPGHHRFAIVDKGARRPLDPKVPRL